MTINHSLQSLAAGIAILFATSCGNDYEINDTDISTAVKMEVSSITASEATVTLTPTQEVASYVVAGPVTDGTFNYLGTDAVGCLDWIMTKGKSYSAPFEVTFSGLAEETSYLVGFVALNERGTVVSAPAFGTFKTASSL